MKLTMDQEAHLVVDGFLPGDAEYADGYSRDILIPRKL